MGQTACAATRGPIPTEETYVRLTAMSLWEHSPALLASGLLFSVLLAPALFFCLVGLWIPALALGTLTVPPAWTALLAAESGIIRGTGGPGSLLRALPRYYARAIGVGLPLCFPLLVAGLTLVLASRAGLSPIIWFGLSADVLALLLLLALYVYAFPLIVSYDLGARDALRNALILASRHINNTLGLMGLGVLFTLGVFYISPGLMFILATVWGVFVLNNARMVVAEEKVRAKNGHVARPA